MIIRFIDRIICNGLDYTSPLCRKGNSLSYCARVGQLTVIVIAVLCGACSEDQSFVAVDTLIESRGIEVPATFMRPGSKSEKVPLVVMAHGHGGTRDEAGGFERVANELSINGVASIRMDFSGCGESSEPFTENFLTNMLADIRAAREFAGQHQQIDMQRVGILGYSMGGRLAMLATAEDAYSTVVLWAPVASNGSESVFDILGGPEAYGLLAAEAREAGFASITTPWGAELQLGPQWFTDLEETNPLSVIHEYEGALLVIYGNRDDAVNPRYSKQAITSAVRSRPRVENIVDGGGHGLGFYDDLPVMANGVVAATTRFFTENL